MTSILKKLSVLIIVLSASMLAGSTLAVAETESDAAVLIDLKTERAAYRAIRNEPTLSAYPITLGCVDGVVLLHGTVDNDTEKKLVERLVKNVEGVSEVRNYLVLSS